LYGTELLIQENEEKGVLVNNLHDTAKDMLVSLRETLWAMKTADVTAAEVWLRIINFSKQMQRYYQAISITTSGTVPDDFYMNSAKALNAVLIVQEAVNNAARHAMAAIILIKSEPGAGAWQIEIMDDGKGFDITAMQKKKDSYGLTNMNERATSAGLQMEIHTQALSGTRVVIQIPFS
jgi:signal transduction histidine kinase